MSLSNDHSIVTEYVEAWNRHDSDTIVDTFAENGNYDDPIVPGKIRLAGEAIGEYAADLWKAFPDLSFDVKRLASIDDSTVLLQWTMKGTHEGPLEELPSTGETIDLPGVDIIEVSEDGITSVRGYFNVGTLMEQLGCRVDVNPKQLGPVKFGVSYRLDLGKKTEPGAFSLTSITFRNDQDEKAITEHARKIFQQMEEMDGVISSVITRDGERGYTMTAWENPEDAKQLMSGGAHKSAVKEFFEHDGLGAGGMTSIWTLERMNGRLLRCTECLEMTYEVEAESCPECGATLPEAPPYW